MSEKALGSRLAAALEEAGLPWRRGVSLESMARQLLRENKSLFVGFLSKYDMAFDARDGLLYNLNDLGDYVDWQFGVLAKLAVGERKENEIWQA